MQQRDSSGWLEIAGVNRSVEVTGITFKDVALQGMWGNEPSSGINNRRWALKASEGVIRAEKLGNSSGAKDPEQEHASTQEAWRTRLDTNPTTEDRNGSTPDKSQPNVLEDRWRFKADIELPVKVAELRQKLNQKAKQEPKFRFYALYDRIYRADVLTAAWWLVLHKDKSPGIDGVTCTDIMESPGGIEQYLKDLAQALRTKSYRPDRVKRVYIDKPDGSKRPLGIPTMRDRIVQTAAVLILEPIFEADFKDSSYGFRPERSAHDALWEIQVNLEKGFQDVYDADLKGYFDTIPHDKLMLCLKMRVTDRSVLNLIQMWLESEVEEDDPNGKRKVTRPKQGTPQGGVISPLLSNVYLHWFEHLFYGRQGPAQWARATMVRYADDFVILARYVSLRLQRWIEAQLEGRFQLTINRVKTKVLSLNTTDHQRLDFLGYTMSYDRDLQGRDHRYLNIQPSRKALAKARDKIRALTHTSRCFVPVPVLVNEINQWFRGWLAYFGHGYPAKAFHQIHNYVVYRLVKHLKRRSQRPYRPPKGKTFYAHIHDLGLIDPRPPLDRA